MTNNIEPRTKRVASFVTGGSLVLVGFLLLLMQVLDITFDIGNIAWPFFIILPGIVLFVISLANSGKEGERLAIIGSVVTAVGLLLLYQRSTDHWENWAYTWALVVPTAVGVGQMIYGSVKHQRELVRTGARLSVIGSVIFLAGFFFFEAVIGIGGFGLTRFGLGGFGWPVLLIGLGSLVILYDLLARRGSQPPQHGSTQ
jgi:membrane-associated HD superfamily phosphohydrolase